MTAVLITGAAARVGRVIALHLAARGSDIALHYHTSQAEALALQAEIRALGRECALLRADLSTVAEVQALARAAMEAFPHLDALVNNASAFERAPLAEADAASYALHMDVNLRAPVLLTQALAGVWGQGSVVNLLDAKITQPTHNYFYYLLSKKALAEFTRMAAAELAPRVRVNGVALGRVLPDKTPGASAGAPQKTPTATPEEVAAAVYALLAHPTRTGEVVGVG